MGIAPIRIQIDTSVDESAASGGPGFEAFQELLAEAGKQKPAQPFVPIIPETLQTPLQARQAVTSGIESGARSYVPVDGKGVRLAPAAVQKAWDKTTPREKFEIAARASRSAETPGNAALQRLTAAARNVTTLEKQLESYKRDGGPQALQRHALLEPQLEHAKREFSAVQAEAGPAVLDYQLKSAYAAKLKSHLVLNHVESTVRQAHADFDQFARSNPPAAELDKRKAQLADLDRQLPLYRQAAKTDSARFDALYAQNYANALTARAAVSGGDPKVAQVIAQNAGAQVKIATEIANEKSTDALLQKSQLGLSVEQYQFTAKSNESRSAHLDWAPSTRALSEAQQRLTKLQADLKALPKPATAADAASHYEQTTQLGRQIEVASQSVDEAKKKVGICQTSVERAKTALDQSRVGLGKATLDLQRSQFIADFDKFQGGLPENLKNPKTDSDRRELALKQNEFGRAHQFNTGEALSVDDAIKAVKDDLAVEEKSLNSRPVTQWAADAIGGVFGGHRSELEDHLKSTLENLENFKKIHGNQPADSYQTLLHGLLKDYGKDYVGLSKSEQQNDSHWRSAQNVLRTVGAIGAAVAVTVGTGGAGAGVGAAILWGTVAGVGAYQAIDGADNLSVAARGGDITRGGHVGLIGLANEAIHGRATGHEARLAAVDLVTETISSASVSGGTVAAGAVSAQLAGRVLPNVMTGTEGLSMALPGVAGQGLSEVAAFNATKSLAVRALSTAGGAFTSQSVQGAGQVVNTAVSLGVDGKLGAKEGGQILGEELKNQAFYTLAAPVFGGVTARIPANAGLAQFGANLAGNVVQSEGRSLVVDGRHMNGDDLIAAGLMAGPHMMQMLAANPHDPQRLAAVEAAARKTNNDVLGNSNQASDGFSVVLRGADIGSFGTGEVAGGHYHNLSATNAFDVISRVPPERRQGAIDRSGLSKILEANEPEEDYFVRFKYQPTPDVPYGRTPEEFNPYSLSATVPVQTVTDPAPVRIGGSDYDIIGVDAKKGQLQLRLSSEIDRFIPRRELLPRDGETAGQLVSFGGQQYTVQNIETRKALPGGKEPSAGREPPNGFTLRPVGAGADASEDIFVPAYRMGEIRLNSKDGPSHDVVGITVPSVHLRPATTTTAEKTLQNGDRFQAFIRNAESGGPVTLEYRNGRLAVVDSTNPHLQAGATVGLGDVVPSRVNIRSQHHLGYDLIGSDGVSNRGPMVEQPLSAILTDINRGAPGSLTLGAAPAVPVIHRYEGLIQDQADFIKSYQDPVPPRQLVIHNIAYEFGRDKNGADAKPLLDALVDFRRRYPDTPMVVYGGGDSFKLAEKRGTKDDLLATLKENNIEVRLVTGTDSKEFITHAKGIEILPGEGGTPAAMITTAGAFLNKDKSDISIRLDPEYSDLYGRYIELATQPDFAGTGDARKAMATELAARGIVIQDTVAEQSVVRQSINELTAGAQGSLLVQFRELRMPSMTKRFIDAAKRGVDVTVQFKVVDADSLSALQAARKKYPNLRFEQVPEPGGYAHYNTVIADGNKAYVGSGYPWSSMMYPASHWEPASEAGVLLRGASVQQLLGQINQYQLNEVKSPAWRAGIDALAKFEGRRPN